MTPEEAKAKELIKKFEVLVPEEFGGMDLELAKQCSKIVCDEILELDVVKCRIGLTYLWKKIKKEIENHD